MQDPLPRPNRWKIPPQSNNHVGTLFHVAGTSNKTIYYTPGKDFLGGHPY